MSQPLAPKDPDLLPRPAGEPFFRQATPEPRADGPTPSPTEEALRISEEKFAKAFRSSPDAMLISSVATSKIVDANDGFTRITGFAWDEAVGHTAIELGLWPDLGDRRLLMEELTRDGRVRSRELTYLDKTGATVHCLLSFELIELEGGPHILTVGRDITAQKRAEADRERVVQELEAKNTELERFTYTVSHDLKSPLVTIRGFLGLLEQDIAKGESERVERDIERIKAATDTMQELLDDLLELSRIGRMAGTPEPLELGELARLASQQVAGPLAQRGVDLKIADDLPVVTGDRVRLLQVFQNLLDNAVKFLGDQPDPKVEVGVRRDPPDDRTIFFVRDNGIGVDPAHHRRIFGLFARLDQSVEGTGIGLALVERILGVHGGEIWVESEGDGQGSTFCFTLPDP